MNLKACRQHTWIVTLLCVGHCFCAVTLTQSSTNVDKGSSLNIIATLDEASLSWTYKGGTPLSTCSLALNACFPSLEENMMFTASSTTNTSTLSIASLNCSINTAVYVASTGSLLTDTVNIDVTTPVSSRVSTTVLTASKVPSQDLLVEVKCVYPRSTITANFTISRSGKPDDILFPDSIQTSTSSSGCECFEDTYVVKKTITALQYPNEVVQVQANIGQLSPLVIGDVNFTAGSSEEKSSNVDTIVGAVLGSVAGVGLTSGLVVVGSKLVKKQASVKNSEEDKSNKNSNEDESKKNSKKRKSKNKKDKTNADDAKDGRSAAAPDSAGVKADQNSAKAKQNVEFINEERSNMLKNKGSSNVEQKGTHTDDMEHKGTNSNNETKTDTTDEAAVTEEKTIFLYMNTA